MGIKTVEDAIIDRIKVGVALGTGVANVRAVESIPGELDEDMLRNLMLKAPGVFVAFSGGSVKNSGGETAMIDARWVVLALTAHKNNEAPRRRGDAVQIGAYEILERVVPKLHGHTVPDEGTLKCTDVDNLTNAAMQKLGVAVYGATFTMPMAMPADLDLATLPPFEKFEVMWDIPKLETAAEHEKWLAGDESTSKPDAKDSVRPEQS